MGLTGTVAAGKSTVGRLFEKWGAARIDADRLARDAVAPGTPGLARIVEAWGDAVLDPDGRLDRAAMRCIAFDDATARTRLEKIVHVEVRRLRDIWREESRAAGAEVLVEEIPLLFETGMEDAYDAIVVVDAPRDQRRLRATASRGWSADEFDAIDSSQLPAEEKRARADHVIVNDRDGKYLERRARAVWDLLAGPASGGQD
ncbi:MAG: dephospho-CoA kinase [Gemmatimonadota bacterium]|nr:dephospho-CoA kinase [Gemmatimonadota bacterium]